MADIYKVTYTFWKSLLGNCYWNCSPNGSKSKSHFSGRKPGLCQSRAVNVSARRPDGSQLWLRLAFRRDMWRRRQKRPHSRSESRVTPPLGVRYGNQSLALRSVCVWRGGLGAGRTPESLQDRGHASCPTHKNSHFLVLGLWGKAWRFKICFANYKLRFMNFQCDLNVTIVWLSMNNNLLKQF